MKRITIIDTNFGAFKLYADWAQASSPVWLDDQVTQYQVASFRHNEREAIRALVLEPEGLGWKDVEVLGAIELEEDELEALNELIDRLYNAARAPLIEAAVELEKALAAAPYRDLKETRRAIEKLLEVAERGKLDGFAARSVRSAARTLQKRGLN